MGLTRKPKRGEVYLVSVDPRSTQGREIQKTRPYVIVSPEFMNRRLATFLCAPMTRGSYNYASRVKVKFNESDSYIVLDQLRVIDQSRMIKRLGKIPPGKTSEILAILREIFSEDSPHI